MSRRLLLTYLSLTLVVLAALEIPLGVVNARSERQDLTAKIERDATAVASLAEATLEHDATADLPAIRALARRYSADTGGRVVIVDRKGNAIVDTSSPASAGRSFSSRPEIAAALGGNVVTGTRYSATLGASFLYVAVPIASGGQILGAVRITYPTSELDARIRRYWLVLLGIAAVVLAGAAILGASFARWIRRPLTGLEEAAAGAAAGDLTVRAPVPDGPPELRALAVEFNGMVAKLDALVSSQRDFVADASHELRTPLTALRLRLENLDEQVGPEGRAGLDAALAEIDRLAGTVESLLALARADAGAAPAGAVDLAAVAAGRVEAWWAAAREANVELRRDAEPAPPASAGADRVAQVLDNLLANALAVAPPGTAVSVAVRPAGARVELLVRDNGPGLTDDQKARAFDRFWRAGSGSGGSGLGLAVVRRLVEADGGAVELRDAAGGGLEVVIRFALA